MPDLGSQLSPSWSIFDSCLARYPAAAHPSFSVRLPRFPPVRSVTSPIAVQPSRATTTKINPSRNQLGRRIFEPPMDSASFNSSALSHRRHPPPTPHFPIPSDNQPTRFFVRLALFHFLSTTHYQPHILVVTSVNLSFLSFLRRFFQFVGLSVRKLVRWA
jgi:hypothetical protein